MGIEPRPGPPQLLPPRALVIVAVFIGVLYAVGMAVRGDTVPGIVGGALAGILMLLVLRRAQEQRMQRWRRREADRQG